MEKIYIWLAWRIPKNLTYWITVRFILSTNWGISHAEHINRQVEILRTLRRWRDSTG
jgi:hypothetical protein